MKEKKYLPKALVISAFRRQRLNVELETFSWGVHGQLGLGGIDDEWSPRLVTKLQGRKVSATSSNSRRDR